MQRTDDMNEIDQNCPMCRHPCGAVLESITFNDLKRIYTGTTSLSEQDYPFASGVDYRSCANCKLRYFTPGAGGTPEFYNSLQRFPWYYLATKYEYEYAAQILNPKWSVLE